MPYNKKQRQSGGSDFMHSFYSSTAMGGPAAISSATLAGINNAPMFNPLSTSSAIPGISTGIVPSGLYLASGGQAGGDCGCQSGGGELKFAQRGGSCARPQRGGSYAQIGGSCARPQRGGSCARPQRGGSCARPQRGGSCARPQRGGSCARPQRGGSLEALRTECNNKGMSCRRRDGTYKSRNELLQMLDA